PTVAPELQPQDGPAVEEIEMQFQRLVLSAEPPWAAFCEASTDVLRAWLTLALLNANGSYLDAARLFHVPEKDYRRFMDVLRRKSCVINPAPFRKMPAGAERR